MPYLVDGNNVMAQTAEWRHDKVKARRRLIQELVQFVAAHRVKLKVVFDGAPDEQFPEGMRFKGVFICYAKPGGTADDRIMDLVRKSYHKRDLIVVTSDKPLGSYANRHGARIIQSRAFRQMLDEAGRAVQGKPDENRPVDLDEWLDYFGSSRN